MSWKVFGLEPECEDGAVIGLGTGDTHAVAAGSFRSVLPLLETSPPYRFQKRSTFPHRTLPMLKVTDCKMEC